MRAIVRAFAALLAFLTFAEAPALASPINVGICGVLAPSYTDADVTDIHDDYYPSSPVSQEAWGMHVKVFEHGTTTKVFDDFLQPKPGANPGCTTITAVPVDTTKTYDVKFLSDASFPGDSNTLLYRVYSTNNEIDFFWNGHSFTTGSTYTTFTVGDSAPARAMAASILALSRHDAGITGVEFDEFGCTDVEATAKCEAATSCNLGGQIFFDTQTDQTVFKTVIGKEFGGLILTKGATNTIPGPNYCGVAVNSCPSGNDSGCTNTPPNGGFLVNSLEYHSAAVKEGFGRFYRDATFNDLGGTGCGAYDKSGTVLNPGPDWDLDGNGDGHFYDCDGPPKAGMVDSDYEDEECSGASSLAGLATVYDYERFFWDMDYTEGADVGDLVQIMSDANAGSGWNRDYQGNSDDVVPRLKTTADAGIWGSAWDYQSADNGVFR